MTHEIHYALLVIAAALALTWPMGCSMETARRITPPAAAVGCAALDVVTTVVGREAYDLEEANPLMRNYGVFVGAKVGLFAGLYIWNRWVSQLSPGFWWGAAAGNCGIAIWNATQIAREAN